jgi:uncharacterized membrane protein (UPF0127 family)
MTKNLRKISEKKQLKKNYKPIIQKIIIGLVLIIIAGFFVYNNLIKKTEPAMEYYTFKKEGGLVLSDSLGNAKVKIDIEIADTDYDRQLGLMKRVSMGEKQGMLFIFSVDAMQSFWMRNMLISLDMIFIGSNKKIVTIYKNTKILSDQSYPSTSQAQYVLEVNAGFTDKYKVNVGDMIAWNVIPKL